MGPQHRGLVPIALSKEHYGTSAVLQLEVQVSGEPVEETSRFPIIFFKVLGQDIHEVTLFQFIHNKEIAIAARSAIIPKAIAPLILKHEQMHIEPQQVV